MNRLSTFTICAALSGLFVLTAAGPKASNGIASTTTTKDGFTSSVVGVQWQMADFTLDKAIDFDGDGKLETELTQFLNPCDLDNTVTFESNGTMSVETGELQCDGKQGFTSPKLSNWSYDEGTNMLSLVNGSTKSVSQWRILESSAKHLKIKMPLDKDGQSATVTWKTL
ncbi:hypothetical protein GO755_00790 [Spirosoma sp. HMF4905]|uniref:Lipocalin-like domain-containing protein n=1 Tax=Spirosoma arboris TaxID=2682092 RepID=A0A7K1S4N7_9BACT|nr:hypothetical protein [Spirosoma arboris]MVM28548.1 hypothetical protein [Spirosoma arboris]